MPLSSTATRTPLPVTPRPCSVSRADIRDRFVEVVPIDARRARRARRRHRTTALRARRARRSRNTALATSCTEPMACALGAMLATLRQECTLLADDRRLARAFACADSGGVQRDCDFDATLGCAVATAAEPSTSSGAGSLVAAMRAALGMPPRARSAAPALAAARVMAAVERSDSACAIVLRRSFFMLISLCRSCDETPPGIGERDAFLAAKAR